MMRASREAPLTQLTGACERAWHRRRLWLEARAAARRPTPAPLAPASRHAGTHGRDRSAIRRPPAASCGPGPRDARSAALLLRSGPARRPGRRSTRLYRHGDAAERRAVSCALHLLAVGDAGVLPLVEDALRTNDTRLVAAAVGPYAAATSTPTPGATPS